MLAPARHFNGQLDREWQTCLFLSCHARESRTSNDLGCRTPSQEPRAFPFAGTAFADDDTGGATEMPRYHERLIASER